jgi:hypothetical protein
MGEKTRRYQLEACDAYPYGGLSAAIRSGKSPPALPISDWSLRPLIAKAPPRLSIESILDRWKEARGHGTETVPPITLAPAAEKRVSSIEGCALRRRRDALTSGAWLCWWFTSSWEELPSLTVIRAYVRPCALRRDK